MKHLSHVVETIEGRLLVNHRMDPGKALCALAPNGTVAPSAAPQCA
jgi:hypothetical protein